MLKVGDTVKVINKTLFYTEITEVIPIGTICRVTSTEYSEKEGNIVGIVPLDGSREYWYLECEVEKLESNVIKNPEISNKSLEEFINRMEMNGINSDAMMCVIENLSHLAADNGFDREGFFDELINMMNKD